jgi:hypothetical protein
MPLEELLERIRDAGWSVGVHNDYRLNGVAMTFWLFTHPSGRWVRAEAATDREALEEIWRSVQSGQPLLVPATSNEEQRARDDKWKAQQDRFAAWTNKAWRG